MLGLIVGDALGVPVEFQSRESLQKDPVQFMRAFGTYQQPAGTWSDDSSLALSQAESLLKGFDLIDMATKFVQWQKAEIWTPHGEVFDIGITTAQAIDHLAELLAAHRFGEIQELNQIDDERTNGNGSLMRVLSLYWHLRRNGTLESQFQTIWQVSALTHYHLRAALACLFYLIMVDELGRGKDPVAAYRDTRARMHQFFHTYPTFAREQSHFNRLMEKDIRGVPMDAIRSDGYVIHSLEAAVWCLLRHDHYAGVVLEAVNLGEDTDTTAAIAGGLAGLYFGRDNIPSDWIEALARKEDIFKLCEQFNVEL